MIESVEKGNTISYSINSNQNESNRNELVLFFLLPSLCLQASIDILVSSK